jgi:transcription elongation factor Elf1
MSLEERKRYIECPYCHSKYVYTNDKINEKGFVQCQNCAKWVSASAGQQASGSVPEQQAVPQYVSWSDRRKMSPENVWSDLPKIFVHGLAFSLLFNVWAAVWLIAFILIMYMGVIIAGFLGMFGGIALGVALLLFVLGGLNALLSKSLWGISCRNKGTSLIGQGAVIFGLMFCIGIPSLLLPVLLTRLDTVSYILAQIVLFVVYSIIDGYMGRFVGLQFEVGQDHVTELPEGSRRAKCPHCGATYAYLPSAIDSEENVSCQNCGRRFKLP